MMQSLRYTHHVAYKLVRSNTTPIRHMSAHSTSPKSALRPKVTLPMLQNMHKEGKPIAMLTAYDYPTGRLCERTNVDITLVGDSLAQVCLGYDASSQLTLDEMIHHCRAVARGSKSPFFMADMPFGTYFTPEDAIRNAGRLVREAGIEGVKLEGGLEVVEIIKKLTDFGIPVMGHIGLMPQRASSMGGFTVQGKTQKSASSILSIALRLQEAGVFALLLEAVPSIVGGYISRNVHNVPIIGIGAGNQVDGQVLVVTDALGITPKPPKFVRRFAEFGDTAETSINSFVDAVKSRDFPSREESYLMSREEAQALRASIDFPLSTSHTANQNTVPITHSSPTESSVDTKGGK